MELSILEPWGPRPCRQVRFLPSCPAVGEQGEQISQGHFCLLVLSVTEQPNGSGCWNVYCAAICCSFMMSTAYIFCILIKCHLTVPVLVVLELWGCFSKGYNFVYQMAKKQNHLFCKTEAAKGRRGWRYTVPIQSNLDWGSQPQGIDFPGLRTTVVTEGGRGSGCGGKADC